MEPRVNNSTSSLSTNYPQGEGYKNPNGSGGAEQQDFPVQLPEGLTAGQVLEYCRIRNKSFDGWWRDVDARLVQLWRMFENQSTAQVKSTKVVTLPIANGIIETINARLSPGILNRPKFVETIQEFLAPSDDLRLNVDYFVNQRVAYETRKPEKGKALLKGVIIESVAIWRSLWKIDTVKGSVPQYRPDPAWMPDPSNPGPQEPPQIYIGEQPTEYQRQYWTFEYKAPGNMAWEPTCSTRLQDSPWVRERSKMSLNELLQWQAEGKIMDVDKIAQIVPASLDASQKEDWELKRRESLGEKNLNFCYADDKAYKVDEWFARMTWKAADENYKSQEFHWFVVEDTVIVMFGENELPDQEHPYGSCPFAVVPRSVMGLAACDPIKGTQEQVNMFAGKQNDLVDRASNPTTYYDDKSGISNRATFMRTNGLQPVLDVKGIYQPPVDATPIKVNQEYINFCIQLCRDITGANDQVQGIEGADTATEYQGLVAAAGSRFAEVAETINAMFIGDLAEKCFKFYQKFGVDGQMIAHDTASSGTAISLTREDLKGEYRFLPATSQTQVNKEKMVANDTQFLQTMSQIPPAQLGGKLYNFAKHIQEISLPLRDQKSGKEFFIDAPVPVMPPNGVPLPGPGEASAVPPEAMMGA